MWCTNNIRVSYGVVNNIAKEEIEKAIFENIGQRKAAIIRKTYHMSSEDVQFVVYNNMRNGVIEVMLAEEETVKGLVFA